MTGQPTRLDVDCSKAGAPDPAFAEEFRQAALAQLEKGNLDKAAALMQEAKEVFAASQQATETKVPLTDAEVKEQAAAEEAHLDRVREGKKAEIRAALAATDYWVVRASEDGEQLSKPRAAYRKKLRDLIGKTADAKTFKAVAAIEIPDPPAN